MGYGAEVAALLADEALRVSRRAGQAAGGAGRARRALQPSDAGILHAQPGHHRRRDPRFGRVLTKR